MDYIRSIEEIKKRFETADHVGVKTVNTEDDLERCLVKFFFYRPALIRLFNFLPGNRMAHNAARHVASA